MLNKKIKSLSYQTIRQKVLNYILEEYKKQRSDIIKLPLSKKKIAEQLGIPRPSLSRELICMKDEGLIEIDKDKIKIIDFARFEEVILEI